jgi:hypothetical protein
MMLVISLMLMRTTSLTLHKTMDVAVHNRYPDIELTSPAYFCSHGTLYEYPIETADTGAMMKTGFRYDHGQDEYGSILMYKVQRKVKSDHQSNTDITSVEDTWERIRLLVAWKFKRSKGLNVRIMLVEHDMWLVLNEDNLAKLYEKINDIPSGVYILFFRHDGIYKSTWLIGDDTVLEVAYEVICKECIELKIIISEGAKDKDAKLALWIDSERQVSSLIM